MTADSIARREDVILAIVDVQERLSAAMDRREAVVAASVRLAKTAALLGIPAIVTRQYPKGLGDLDATLGDALLDAESAGMRLTRADKVAFDCFGEPAFAEALAESGRRQLLIAGMETHICITQTALSGIRSGYDVHVVADACCSRDDEHHALALARLRFAGAVVTTSESAMYEMVGEAGTDEFRALLGIVKE